MICRDITISRVVYNLPTGLYYKVGSEYPKQLPDDITGMLTFFISKEESVTNLEIKGMMKVLYLFMDTNEHSESMLRQDKYEDKSIYIIYIIREKETGFYYHFDSESMSFCSVGEFLLWI